jgi:hypothetical protein
MWISPVFSFIKVTHAVVIRVENPAIRYERIIAPVYLPSVVHAIAVGVWIQRVSTSNRLVNITQAVIVVVLIHEVG